MSGHGAGGGGGRGGEEMDTLIAGAMHGKWDMIGDGTRVPAAAVAAAAMHNSSGSNEQQRQLKQLKI